MLAFERLMGLRYLFSKRKGSFFSLTTLISIGGVASGVLTLIVVLSVMNGFGKDLQDKILGFKSHIVIEAKDFSPFEYSPPFLKNLKALDPNIIDVTPSLSSEMMVRHGSDLTGVLFKGMAPPLQGIKKGKEGHPPILLGRELAQSLGAYEGDVVEVISPIETTGPLGVIPKMRSYYVANLFATGLYEYDTKLIYVSLRDAQDFLEVPNRIDAIEIKVSDIYKTGVVIQKIKSLPEAQSLLIRDWRELNKNLFHALKLEKIAMFVILLLMVLVAALNIVTTVTRMVLTKRKEISILKAMGANRNQILHIFLFQGMVIGSVGLLAGLLSGYAICLILGRFELIRLPDIYYNTSVPVQMQPGYFVVIGLASFLITGLCSFFPAWKASRVHPLQGIRYLT